MTIVFLEGIGGAIEGAGYADKRPSAIEGVGLVNQEGWYD